MEAFGPKLLGRSWANSNDTQSRNYYVTTVDNLHGHGTTATTLALVTGYLAVLVLGLAGNGLVIAVMSKSPHMRTVTNYFVTNMAVADLLALVVCILPKLISSIYAQRILGRLLCKTVPYIGGVTVCMSAYSLVAILLDRVCAMFPPPTCGGLFLKFRVTKKMARRIIGMLWLWAGALALPRLLFSDSLHAHEGRAAAGVVCTESWPRGMDENAYFILVDLTLFYLLPLATIGLCYFFIWLRIWNRRQQQPPDDLTLPTLEVLSQIRTSLSALRKLTIVVAAFAISWLPLYSLWLRLRLGSSVMRGSAEEASLDLALAMAQLLGASNYCLNPTLYYILNAKFRQALLELLWGHDSKKKSVPHDRKLNELTSVGCVQMQISACNYPPSDCDDAAPKDENVFKLGTNNACRGNDNV